MKKKLLGVVLASCALVSMAQARFYFGVEGGYSAQAWHDSGIGGKANSFSIYAPSTGIISDALNHGSNGFSVGGVFGTEDFYGKYFGTRWGLGAGYTEVSKNSTTWKYVDAGFSLDLMLNFFNSGSFSIGVFGGVGADYHYALNGADDALNSKHFFDFSGRVGVSTLMARHHRIEFIAKLPIASMSATSSSKYELGAVGVPARTTFGASYKFVF